MTLPVRKLTRFQAPPTRSFGTRVLTRSQIPTDKMSLPVIIVNVDYQDEKGIRN